MTVNKKLFFELLAKHFSEIPFNQTEEWLQSVASKNLIHYFINNSDKPEIACWGRVFKRRLIGNHLIIDGISIKTENIRIIRDFFWDIVNHGYSIVEISDIGIYSTFFEIGIRQAGYIRPILSLSPLSLIVKTQDPFNFQRHWKRSVKKALENGCKFEIVENISDNHLKEFVALFSQLKNRKGLKFSLSVSSLFVLLKNKKYKMFFIKNNDEYLSGRIIYIEGEKSYDVFAANSDEGIKVGAAYLIQESILKYLKILGLKQFDYGRIPPSNDEMNNIYLAKSFSGGEPVLYNGQWLYTKNKRIILIYEFYKYFIKNQRRY